MSWFDTSGFASLAKSALKEAQKTIDKALDIKDEEQRQSLASQSSTSSSDFFDSYGVKNEELCQDKELNPSQKQQNTSIWGSFTGSFFDPKEDMTAIAAKHAEPFKDSNEKNDKLKTLLVTSKSFPESLSDKSSNKVLSDCAIAETTDLSFSTITSKSESIEEFLSEASSIENVQENQEQSMSTTPSTKSEEIRPSSLESCSSTKKTTVIPRKKEPTANQSLNRLSVLSAESDKKSSESVEVLGSPSDYTNSPDSEVNSLSVSVGLKINSESVEVLPDSLMTSPSSVEVLAEWKSDESPYVSPIDDKMFETSVTPTPGEGMDASFFNESLIDAEDIKSSTSTLEAHPTGDSRTSLTSSRNKDVELSNDGIEDGEETSLADDSYTSASESTLLTIMDPQVMQGSCTDVRQIMSMSGGSEYSMNLSVESLKDKSNLANLQLPIEAITKQPIRTDPSKKPVDLDNPYDRLKSSTIEPPENMQKADSFERMLTDSSCEETLVESCGSEENVLAQKHQPLTTSSYVKNMLAEAMVEKELSGGSDERDKGERLRDNSPISSESRSDLVKIGSDQTSGHTSGDELETTTSSDIEIISRYSPNGDSSSTQSRQSPAKSQLSNKTADLLTKTLKTRGHSRELSEISVGSDDTTNPEIERLLRRVREMTEILEARESKLIEVSRTNMELHEQNSNLKKQLDNRKHAESSQDLSQITDEYTQRLSALERKFQQAIRERDSLRKSLDAVKQETAARFSAEMSSANAEKDEIIKELREEGEKLSKQQLQHCNIIKKLRAKEKESDGLIKTQKEQLEEQTVELERLKRSLYAKEEVERSQIEAVHTLTAKSKKQEKEILSLQEQLDHNTNKMDAYKKSFEAAKAELLETKEKMIDMEQELKLAVENAGESHQLLAQVEDLKIKLRKAEESHVKKEQNLKRETTEILKRLEAAESRSEELSSSASLATKPLLRQLEQLQSSLTQKTNLHLRQEEIMTEKIADLQAKVESLNETNRSLREDNVNLKSQCSILEGKVSYLEVDKKKLEEVIENLREESRKLAGENESHKQAIKTQDETFSAEIKELKRQITSLENKLSSEKAAIEAEKRKNHALYEQQQSVDEELRYSPTLSIERDSVSSANSIWPVFNDTFDSGSGRFPSVYQSNSTSTIENLQAQLKQRDGEVQQLQWDLSRRVLERDALNSEVSSLASKIEDLTIQVSDLESVKENLNDIQTKYDALLQMFGEKVEENEELRLDLEDVKEMYKTQIDQLLKRDL